VPFDTLTTGAPELDEILRGGIPKYAAVFVTGSPGSGKTVLCQQALFANATRGASTIYLGTLSEPILKMIRHAQEFAFFVPDLVGRGVVFGDLGDALRSGGGPALLETVDDLVRQHRPDLLVIDSFRVVREFFSDTATFRQFVSELLLRLAAWQVTSLLVGEYTAQELATEPEFAVADGVLHLHGVDEPRRQRRFIRILKMRGTGFFPGDHFFEITEAGLDVYPRMDPNVGGEYAAPSVRVPSAIPGLVEMTAGGLQGASCALVIGSSGTGKTLCAISFLAGAAHEGIPGLLVSFEERAEQLMRNVAQFGWGLEDLERRKLFSVLHVPPSELDLEKHASLIRRRAEALGAGIVVIDTISALEDADDDAERAHNYLWAITDYFKRKGVAAVLTYETSGVTGRAGLNTRLSFLADAIIDVNLVESHGHWRRTIGVRKMRGVHHDNAIRDFIIESGGIRIGEPFEEPRASTGAIA
jgi:circadian clock protein KaiC